MKNSKFPRCDSDQLILGVDPGTCITGYGIVKCEGSKETAIDYGCIRPSSEMKLSERYLAIYHGICELIDRYHPEVVSVETQFVRHNVQSALKLGMARGVVLIAAKQRGIPIFEYAPTKAKLAVTGSGRASKYQVQGMVQRLLQLPSLPHPEDAADALALALCHAHATRQEWSSNFEI